MEEEGVSLIVVIASLIERVRSATRRGGQGMFSFDVVPGKIALEELEVLDIKA